MTASATQKSQNIADADANPRVADTAGEGANYRVNQIDGYVTSQAGDQIGTEYIFARVLTTVKIKNIVLETEAQGAGAGSIGVYYADSLNDVAPGNAPNVGLVIDEDFFASAVSIASAAKTDVTNEAGTYNLGLREEPLWQAVGLPSDPGGKFDIVMTLTTAVTTGTGKTGIHVQFSE